MRKNRDIIGIKPLVWGRVGPDPWAELQVDRARGPQAQGLGRPGVFSKGFIGNTSLCVASPEHFNKVEPFFQMAPQWSRFGSTFFFSAGTSQYVYGLNYIIDKPTAEFCIGNK